VSQLRLYNMSAHVVPSGAVLIPLEAKAANWILYWASLEHVMDYKRHLPVGVVIRGESSSGLRKCKVLRHGIDRFKVAAAGGCREANLDFSCGHSVWKEL